jgi:hypothetical protein
VSGLGIRLFGGKLRRRPVAALARLFMDYLTYVGMIVFWLFLLASRRPLAWCERRLDRPIRAGIIAWIARLSRG